ncbi:MAG: hypothetical protein ACK56F_08645 [bacterium]
MDLYAGPCGCDEHITDANGTASHDHLADESSVSARVASRSMDGAESAVDHGSREAVHLGWRDRNRRAHRALLMGA